MRRARGLDDRECGCRPWRRTRRFRAPSNGPEAFFVAQFSAGYTTNMFGFDLRHAQVARQVAVMAALGGEPSGLAANARTSTIPLGSNPGGDAVHAVPVP